MDSGLSTSYLGKTQLYSIRIHSPFRSVASIQLMIQVVSPGNESIQLMTQTVFSGNDSIQLVTQSRKVRH